MWHFNISKLYKFQIDILKNVFTIAGFITYTIYGQPLVLYIVSIMANGYQSEYFDISRGIRQGDSLSALLYIIQFEPLMSKIRNSADIEGVTVNLNNLKEKIEIKGCQYVDDSNNSL